MSTKTVRVCDRCGKERDMFATTEWSETIIEMPAFENQERREKFDLCDLCTNAVKAFLISTPN